MVGNTDANGGPQTYHSQCMTREHLLGLTLASTYFVSRSHIVITKLDLAPQNVRDETINNIGRILKMPPTDRHCLDQ